MSISKRGWASIRWGLLGLAAGWVCLAGGPARADKYDVAKALVSPAIDSTEPIKDVVEAVTRFNNGDFDSARLFLNQARKDNPKLPPAELMLAQMLASANQGQAARAELERCVKMNPDDPEAYLIFGDGAFADGRVTDAEMEFCESQSADCQLQGKCQAGTQFQCSFRSRLGCRLRGAGRLGRSQNASRSVADDRRSASGEGPGRQPRARKIAAPGARTIGPRAVQGRQVE